IRRDELLQVHGADYLDSLESSAVLAEALEVPPLAALPAAMLDAEVLEPMRWATRGTVLAAEAALVDGAAVNLGGGFHHAKRNRGEGFTLYSDLAVAVELLDAAGRLGRRDGPRVGFIDLDAHQGNGPKSIFEDDDRAVFLDVFNGQIYPAERFAVEPPSVDVELPMGTTTAVYLEAVKAAVPAFLDASGAMDLVFYVAGTDIYEHDPLGLLRVSAEGMVERDLFVTETLTAAGIPWVMVTAGGYTEESHRSIASAVGGMLDRWPVE
ncbi:MAG: histone deacetylase, partial [Acidobacteriota bacterium]